MEIVYIGAKTRPAVQGTTRGKHVLAGIAPHTFSLSTLSFTHVARLGLATRETN